MGQKSRDVIEVTPSVWYTKEKSINFHCKICNLAIQNKKGSPRRFRLCLHHLQKFDYLVGDDPQIRYCQQCACFHPITHFNKNNSNCSASMLARKQANQSKKSIIDHQIPQIKKQQYINDANASASCSLKDDILSVSSPNIEYPSYLQRTTDQAGNSIYRQNSAGSQFFMTRQTSIKQQRTSCDLTQVPSQTQNQQNSCKVQNISTAKYDSVQIDEAFKFAKQSVQTSPLRTQDVLLAQTTWQSDNNVQKLQNNQLICKDQSPSLTNQSNSYYVGLDNQQMSQDPQQFIPSQYQYTPFRTQQHHQNLRLLNSLPEQIQTIRQYNNDSLTDQNGQNISFGPNIDANACSQYCKCRTDNSRWSNTRQQSQQFPIQEKSYIQQSNIQYNQQPSYNSSPVLQCVHSLSQASQSAPPSFFMYYFDQ